VLKVSEIFHSLQGESTHAGRPCLFIRLAGCDLRCAYCDTEYAFQGGTGMSVEEVIEEVRRHGCRLVEVTGGEPLLQEEVYPLLERLIDEEYEVLLETSGAHSTARVPKSVAVILDLKTPGSGMESHNRWENLERLGPGDEVKFVLCDRADYEWAREAVERHALAERHPVLFSPAHGELAPRVLAGWILEDGLSVRLQLQIHKQIWGPEARGV